MKIKDFIGTCGLSWSEHERDFVTKLMEKEGFTFDEWAYVEFVREDLSFIKKLPNVMFQGVHKSWYTNNREIQFKAIPRYIRITFCKKEGFIQFQPKEDITQQYSCFVKLVGGFAYKGTHRQDEQQDEYNDIHSDYHYDTELDIIVGEGIESAATMVLKTKNYAKKRGWK